VWLEETGDDEWGVERSANNEFCKEAMSHNKQYNLDNRICAIITLESGLDGTGFQLTNNDRFS
jgi:hypothetical protein